MGDKLQQIHFARVVTPRMSEEAVQRRRDEAVANIQLRILARLVEMTIRLHGGDMDKLCRVLRCTSEEWNELVDTLNSK